MEAKVLPGYVTEPLEALGQAAVTSARTLNQAAETCLALTMKVQGFVNITDEDVKQILGQRKLIDQLYA